MRDKGLGARRCLVALAPCLPHCSPWRACVRPACRWRGVWPGRGWGCPADRSTARRGRDPPRGWWGWRRDWWGCLALPGGPQSSLSPPRCRTARCNSRYLVDTFRNIKTNWMWRAIGVHSVKWLVVIISESLPIVRLLWDQWTVWGGTMNLLTLHSIWAGLPWWINRSTPPTISTCKYDMVMSRDIFNEVSGCFCWSF